MADIAQVDRIISEVSKLKETEKILFYHKVKKLFDIIEAKQDNVQDMESLFGIIPWDGTDVNIKKLKSERLAQKYESFN